jgi:hypothetical protein
VKAEEQLAGANERAALAEQHAAEANKTAESFRRDIAMANERAAEANRTAEGERLARLKIEERLADRTLTDAQVVAIANKLKPFAGQEVGFTVYWDLKEPMAIANRILAALNRAGWKYIQPLAATLNGEGIAAEFRTENDPSHPSNKISITIGTKP